MKVGFLRSVYLLFFLLTTIFGLYGQDSTFFIRGNIVDVNTGQALSDVNIYSLTTPQKGTASDSNGDFQLAIDQFPTAIRLSSIRFHEQTLLIEDRSQSFFTIKMRPKISELPEVAVSAEARIDTFFTKPYSVIDYDFFEGFIFLLTYKNSIEKYHLLVLDEEGQQQALLSVKAYDPIRFFKNCLGQLYLITELKVYMVSFDANGIQLKNGIWATEFQELINPCVLATDKFVYFSQYYFQGQALRYHTRPIGELGVNHQLPLIEDNRNICLLIEDMGLRLPYSGDVWEEDVREELAELREMTYRVRGMMKIFYPKIYAPIYGRDSLIFIFNHPESQLQYFKETGEALFQIPIDYHQSRKWKKQIFVDEVNGKAYTSFHTRWGEEIRPIHLEDGTLGAGIRLKRAFVKKQKVRNDYLYFLYHNPYNGDRYRQLHKIRID